MVNKKSFQTKFWDRIDITSSCWNWTGCKDFGYGKITINNKNVRVHRLSYSLFKGPLREGLEIDHLCRNRACVNPNHLEQVTKLINQHRGFGWAGINFRKTHCPKGHSLSGDNLYREPSTNHRRCYFSKRNTSKLYVQRRKLIKIG